MQRPIVSSFYRLGDIIGRPATKNRPAVPAIIPVSRSTFLKKVRDGEWPQPVRGLGKRITAWNADEISDLVERVRGSSGRTK